MAYLRCPRWGPGLGRDIVREFEDDCVENGRATTVEEAPGRRPRHIGGDDSASR